MNNDRLTKDDPRYLTAEANIAVLNEWLYELQRTPVRDNDKLLAVSLLKSARRAYEHLCRAWQSDSTYSAWACRNLLELRIFSTYVTRSADNRKRFMIDLAVDSAETAQALGKLVDGIISAADYGIEDHKRNYGKAVSALQVKTGYTDEKFLNPTALAKEMGVEEQVLLCHKLCSKLVHPTAQSILSIDFERLQEGQHQRDVQFLFGADQLGGLLRDLIPLARDLIEQESALGA